jgi:hypothetical protein|nr:MAG TPA: Protein of unknown function (DUF2746) [Caudoviricetes sp.]
MIPAWPHKSPYAEAAARLRDAITIAVIRDAVDEIAAQMGAASRADVTNTHATNIRDDLAALIDESGRP